MKYHTCSKCNERHRTTNFRYARSRHTKKVYRTNTCIYCHRKSQREWLRAKGRTSPESVQTFTGDYTYRMKSKGGKFQKWMSVDGLWDGWLTAYQISELPWVNLEVTSIRKRMRRGQSLGLPASEIPRTFNGHTSPPGTKELTELLKYPPPQYRPQPSFGYR